MLTNTEMLHIHNQISTMIMSSHHTAEFDIAFNYHERNVGGEFIKTLSVNLTIWLEEEPTSLCVYPEHDADYIQRFFNSLTQYLVGNIGVLELENTVGI